MEPMQFASQFLNECHAAETVPARPGAAQRLRTDAAAAAARGP